MKLIFWPFGSTATVAAPTLGQVTLLQLITDALSKIRVARAGDVIPPDDADLGQRAFNRIIDAWNANPRASYAESFTDLILTPNHSPHTIGPGGDFDLAIRPEELLSAAVNLGGSPPVYRPIDVQDAAWYQARALPTLTQPFPVAVYYEPAWPLGSLFFYGVPTQAYPIRLWLRVNLSALALTDVVSLPPGYQQALMLTLAEDLAPDFGQTVAQSTKDAAREARAQIFGNNDVIPSLVTRDAGMPGTPAGRTTYDYRTGFTA